jgi:phenylacetate-coenzyme A ligase PaaK-like adenylate-forming protein
VLTVRVEHDDPAVAGALVDVLTERLAVRPVVAVVPPSTFERFSGKAARLVDRRSR